MRESCADCRTSGCTVTAQCLNVENVGYVCSDCALRFSENTPCSTPAPPNTSGPVAPPPPPSKDCFPVDAVVLLDDGTKRKMGDLNIGDRVQIGRDEYSSIYTFTHRDYEIESEFVHVTLSGGSSLELSHAHYLYVNDKSSVLAADLIKVGDQLFGPSDEKLEVLSKKNVRKKGLFNPHTLSGDIVVNGVLTTTYTEAIHVTAAHSLLAPIRAFYASTGKGTTCLDNISDYRY